VGRDLQVAPPFSQAITGGTLRAVPKLTVTVITRNESANLDAALASVACAD